jgi:uncharacterized membrane protein YeaQ/YmgE (transglycosylase-associated protein family)
VGFIAWIALGLVAGLIAKAIMPGPRASDRPHDRARRRRRASRRFLATALGLGDPIDEFFDLSTWVAAIAGSLIILFLWKAIRERRSPDLRGGFSR